MTNSKISDSDSEQWLAPIQSKQTDTLVLDALALYIASAKLKVGDRLPTERELVEKLQVSRNTIREGLKRWEALGIIRKKKGSGSFLTANVNPGDSFLSLNIRNDAENLMHTLEIRRALETEAGACAALRATEEDLLEIERCIDEVERVHEIYGGAGSEDWNFHSSIYKATHNPMFEQLVSSMYNAFHSFFEAPPEQDFADESLALHRDLFNAIKARDPVEARRLTHEILDITDRDVRRIADDQ